MIHAELMFPLRVTTRTQWSSFSTVATNARTSGRSASRTTRSSGAQTPNTACDRGPRYSAGGRPSGNGKNH